MDILKYHIDKECKPKVKFKKRKYENVLAEKVNLIELVPTNSFAYLYSQDRP